MKKINVTLILILLVKILFAQTPQLWGLASLGGSNNKGLIFKINGDGTGFVAMDSLNYYVGASPRGSLTMVSGNKLWGLTSNGGGGSGTIFSFDLSNNSCTSVFSFTGLYGGNSYGNNLLLASNGMLYGMTTYGGVNNFGVVFKVDPNNNSFTKLHDFNGLNGKQPYGSLIEANNGNLYGMTFWGGVNSNGVIFKYDTTNFTYSVIYNLIGNNDGKFPYGSLLQGINGKLYGLTSSGGINGTGTLFCYDLLTNTYLKAFDFDSIMGASPYGNLIQLSNGKLYGMTRWGGSHNSGVIFNFDPSNNSYNKLYDFDSINGAIPYGSLFNASDGKLYGMSRLGGINNFGVVFSFDPSNNNYIKLHDFDSINGSYPWADFIELIPTGIENLSTKIGVTVFPNPFNNSISIHIEKPNSLLATFVIKNVLGQVVFSIEESKLSNSYTKLIDLSVVSKGIYLLEVIVDGERVVKKIVKE